VSSRRPETGPQAGPEALAPGGKGRPTPKRKEKERRRSGPVAPPPTTRKEAAQRQKEQTRQARQRIRDGALQGDARYLAKRDAGPVRKLVRDLVDSRRNAGVLLLPIALFLVVASFLGNPFIMDVALTMWLAGLLMVLFDLVLLVVTMRRRIHRDFPEEERTRGHVAYGLLRSTVFRRWRMPAAAVEPGTKV
jgi:hypothetical protein